LGTEITKSLPPTSPHPSWNSPIFGTNWYTDGYQLGYPCGYISGMVIARLEIAKACVFRLSQPSRYDLVNWCHDTKQHRKWLVGGIPTPLKNMKVSWDDSSQYGKITHVPNHQPVSSILVHQDVGMVVCLCHHCFGLGLFESLANLCA